VIYALPCDDKKKIADFSSKILDTILYYIDVASMLDGRGYSVVLPGGGV